MHTCPEVQGGRESKSLAFCCWSVSGGGVLVPHWWAEGVLHPHLLAQLQGESGQTCIYLNAINSYFLPILCSYFFFLILMVLLVFMLCS